MTIPNFQRIMDVILRLLESGEPRPLNDLATQAGVTLGLSPSEIQHKVPSGNQTVLRNRVGWAKVYLAQAGLIESTRRGVVRITDRGRDVLAQSPERIDVEFLQRYPEFREFQGRRKPPGNRVARRGRTNRRDDKDDVEATSPAIAASDLEALLLRFNQEYLQTPTGQACLRSYQASRSTANRNWTTLTARSIGADGVGDAALDVLLPHKDSPYNRERGAWIHIAPVIAQEVKPWFESKGWAAPADWPKVAKAVFELIRVGIEDPKGFPAACQSFHESPYSTGIQSAFISPFLNAMRPDSFAIVNSKSRKTLRFVTGIWAPRAIAAYPDTNAKMIAAIAAMTPSLKAIAPEYPPGDVWDQFCHWLVAIAKGDGSPTVRRRRPRIAAQSPESAANVVETLVPDVEFRRACLVFLADAIEAANKTGGMRWCVTLRPRHVRLNIGRRLAVTIDEGRIVVGLPMVSSALGKARDVLGDPDSVFASRTPAAMFVITPEQLSQRGTAIRAAFAEFTRIAATSLRTSPWADSHADGVLTYLEQTLERSLPRPLYTMQGSAAPAQMPAAVAVRTPQAVFKRVDYDLHTLLAYIETGDIGLPEIQRPFVWSATKVRDLFDSMYRGFPVGYLLFWENTTTEKSRGVGLEPKAHKIPGRLIVDGQQRLTALFSVLRGKAVLDDEFRAIRMEIAFRPRDGRFEVSDAAIRKDPEFISDISTLWAANRSSYGIINDFLKNLETRRALSDNDREAIGHNLDRLFDLQKYQFTALEIAPSVDEEAVADIFVRINSEGVKLNQADFILTLLSVFWETGREELEGFARAARTPQVDGHPSPRNHLVDPAPDQLLRVAVAVGFHRGRLRSVYQILRGKDVDTGLVSLEQREEHFTKLKRAQSLSLNLNDWHLFIGAVATAGFRSSAFISSESALMYAYAFYLLGKHQCGVNDIALQRAIGQWFFMAALTGRYTGSTESVVEADLARVRDVSSAEPFLDVLLRITADALPNDYWTITLPSALETSSGRSPAWFAYVAAQNRLGSRVLFSEKKLWDALDPTIQSHRQTVEVHHLFPRAWLEKSGYAKREINQVANLAYLEWPANARIGATGPATYLPGIRNAFTPAAWDRMAREHALPDGWADMEYPEFLQQRRQLMAQVVRVGFESLTGTHDADLHAEIGDGSASEQAVWKQIATLERTLRTLIRRKYVARWSNAADERIRATLGENGWTTLERNRDKYRAQYRGANESAAPDLLEFCYLGQLQQLMVVSDAWELFGEPFRDRRELEDLVRTIVPVRNDGAHFRSVPQRELDRCRLAVEDLLALAERIG